MTTPELTVGSQDNTATAGRAVLAQAGVVISTGSKDDAVERAFDAAVRDSARLGELLDALSEGRLWLPLPVDGRPVTDGSAVHLPTVRYLGSLLIPAYTSAARLLRAAEDLPAAERAPGPHAIVRAADLARRLPPDLGIALNAGASASVPIYPAGVAYLAAERAELGSSRVRVGPLPASGPRELLTAIRAGLCAVKAAREAAAAWLSVELAGEGMIISVSLDDPASAAARDAVVAAVQHMVTTAPGGIGWPVDVTFPGEGEPDVIDRWVAAFAAPFYQRSVGLPAPRPASA